MVTGGKLGAAPDWWACFEAAETCNSQPWIMAGLPGTAGHYSWIEWAMLRKAALADAREEVSRKQQRAAGRKRH